ncbi:Hypp7490 [Branchiostoma lanceolatum]|uniref:Hypp7490 protein n=1 Tax=Branchiostoma lanceolatum TaxID=7740 RepID=A0A8K0EDZ7_BRALA|nr:Hypp7490 [Branchiostoma lanceolatum]
MAVREERNIWELLGVGKDGEVSAKPAGDSGTSAEAFLAAIRSSDIKRIQRIIEKGSDINAKVSQYVLSSLGNIGLGLGATGRSNIARA